MSYQNTQEIILIERVMRLLAWGVLLTAMVLTWSYGSKFFDTASQIDIEIAKKYEVSVEVAGSLTCFKGYLHYPNIGTFSGLVAISPNQECEARVLKQQKHNEYSTMFFVSLLSVFLSLLFVYIFSRKDDGEITSD
jgi:hypothetical protein